MESFFRTVRALVGWARQGLAPNVPVSSSMILLLAGIIFLRQRQVEVTPQRLIDTTSLSSSSVFRHLDKLVDAHILERGSRGYSLSKTVPPEVLRACDTHDGFDVKFLATEVSRTVVESIKPLLATPATVGGSSPTVEDEVEPESSTPLTVKQKFGDVLL